MVGDQPIVSEVCNSNHPSRAAKSEGWDPAKHRKKRSQRAEEVMPDNGTEVPGRRQRMRGGRRSGRAQDMSVIILEVIPVYLYRRPTLGNAERGRAVLDRHPKHIE